MMMVDDDAVGCSTGVFARPRWTILRSNRRLQECSRSPTFCFRRPPGNISRDFLVDDFLLTVSILLRVVL